MAGYTEEEAIAFEAALEVMNKNRFGISKGMADLRRVPAFRAVYGRAPTLADITAKTRTPEFVAWYRDWSDLQALSTAKEAFHHLPYELARAMAKGMKRWFNVEIEQLTRDKIKEDGYEATARILGIDIDEKLLDTEPGPTTEDEDHDG